MIGKHRVGTTWRWRRGKYALPLLLIGLLGIVGPGLASAAQPDGNGESRALPQLQNDAAQAPDREFRLIVTRATQDSTADAKAAAKGKKVKDVDGANAFVATMKGRDIAALANEPSVKYIAPDAAMATTGTVDGSKIGPAYVCTVQVWNCGAWTSMWWAGHSITGSGIGVAILDTGISAQPDFNRSGGASRIVVDQKFNSATNKMSDGMGHGTHVAGIVAGNSWWTGSKATQGKYIGIAPEASLINVKVSDDTGQSYLSDVVNAIEWVITNRQTYNVRVLNLSLVSSVAESAKTSTLDAAVEHAWFSGIFVTVAAGNNGAGTMLYPPANDPFVVTVGAADPMGTTASGDDQMAPWSSYGTTQDGYTKPDVVAPGRYMTSVLASNASYFATTFPQRIVDGAYIQMSGTSMASPVVAGIAALAFQAHPDWTNDQVKWLLLNTSHMLTNAALQPLPGQGAGEVNGASVVYYSTTPGLANQGLPINQQLVGPNGATTYTGSAMNTSTANWSTSSWATANWSTSNWTTSNWSSSNWSTSNWSTNNSTGATVW